MTVTPFGCFSIKSNFSFWDSFCLRCVPEGWAIVCCTWTVLFGADLYPFCWWRVLVNIFNRGQLRSLRGRAVSCWEPVWNGHSNASLLPYKVDHGHVLPLELCSSCFKSNTKGNVPHHPLVMLVLRREGSDPCSKDHLNTFSLHFHPHKQWEELVSRGITGLQIKSICMYLSKRLTQKLIEIIYHATRKWQLWNHYSFATCNRNT